MALLSHLRSMSVFAALAREPWQSRVRTVLSATASMLITLSCILLLLGTGLVFSVYRTAVAFVIWRRTKEPVRFLKGMDATISLESDHSPAIINSVYIVQGKPDVFKVRSFLTHNLVNARCPQGKLLYPNLQEYIHEEYGYLMWRKEPKFSINDHVQMHLGEPLRSYDELNQLVGELSNEPFPPQTAVWNFLLVPLARGFEDLGTEDSHFCMLVRVHHGLADGISLVRIVMAHLIDQDTSELLAKVVPNQKHMNCLSNVKNIFKVVSTTPSSLYRQVISFDKNVLHGVRLSNNKLVAFSRTMPMKTFRHIRSATGTTVNDIIMSCVAGALRQHFLCAGKPVPNDLTAILPVSMHSPGGSIQLCNNCTFIGYQIPAAASTPLQRLTATRANMGRLKESADMWFNLYCFNFLVNRIPKPLTKAYFHSQKVTCIVSNVPGPQEEYSMMGGYNIKRIAFVVPNRGKTGVGFSIISYNDMLQICVIVDSVLVEGQGDVDRMVENFVRELEVLNDAVTTDAST